MGETQERVERRFTDALLLVRAGILSGLVEADDLRELSEAYEDYTDARTGQSIAARSRRASDAGDGR